MEKDEMPGNQPIDLATLLKILDEANKPFLAKLEKIEDRLVHQVTKDDITQLRTEVFDRIDRIEKNVVSNYVPRDFYETRHAQLIERDGRLEQTLREFGTQLDGWKTMQEGRLQSAKREIDDRFAEVYKVMDTKFTEAAKEALSDKDRAWMHWGQWAGWCGVVIAVLSFFAQHIHWTP